MSSCFSCGQMFKGSARELLVYYKRQFETEGIERYFYRLSPKSDLKIVKKKYFKSIFKQEIKPNLINGAEYAHISEVK